jgi:hypothetical protein
MPLLLMLLMLPSFQSSSSDRTTRSVWRTNNWGRSNPKLSIVLDTDIEPKHAAAWNELVNRSEWVVINDPVMTNDFIQSNEFARTNPVQTSDIDRTLPRLTFVSRSSWQTQEPVKSFVEMTQRFSNNLTKVSELDKTTSNVSHASQAGLANLHQAYSKLKFDKKKRTKRSHSLSKRKFLQKHPNRNSINVALTPKIESKKLQENSTWRVRVPRSSDVWRVADPINSDTWRMTDPRSSDSRREAVPRSSNTSKETVPRSRTSFAEKITHSSFNRLQADPRNSTASRRAADLRMSDRMVNWWSNSNKKSTLPFPADESTKLDIRELVRSSERVRYLTKRERLALIRGILASDQADEVAFLAGAEF